MIYQYVFEEGLEMSLVPEKEGTPFASGPKILELGLTGFTGRLIVTQQALKQYSLDNYVLRDHQENKDLSEASSSSSSSSSSVASSSIGPLAARQPRHANATAAAAKQPPPSTTVKRPPPPPPAPAQPAAIITDRPNKRDPPTAKPPPKRPPPFRPAAGQPPQPHPDPIDELAAVFVSSAPPLREYNHASVDIDTSCSSVEVVSVASSVSTRRAKNEETLEQLAAAFLSTPSLQLQKRNDLGQDDIDEGSSCALGSSASFSGPHSNNSQGEGDSNNSQGEGGSARGVLTREDTDDPQDPLSDFAAAFVALSGPSSSTPTAAGKNNGGDSIDEEDRGSKSSLQSTYSTTSPAPSIVSSSASSSSASSLRSDRFSPADTHNKAVPMDPLSEFVEAFGVFSSTPAKPMPNDIMIDEESQAASSSAYSTSAATRSASDQSSTISSSGGNAVSLHSSESHASSSAPSQQSHQQQPLDPLDDFAAAFGALSAGPPREPLEHEMIDEESQSPSPSAATGSVSTGSSSNNSNDNHNKSPASSSRQSDDPLTQFTKVYNENSSINNENSNANNNNTPPVTSGAVVVSRAPEPPSGNGSKRQLQQLPPRPPTQPAAAKQQNNGKTKKRPSSHVPKVKKTTGKTGGTTTTTKPKMSQDKKQQIRDLFPNYPDVSTGSHGSLDPVGVYLHKKCAAPFDKTLMPKDLRELLEVFPFAAYCADEKGRLPLHTLGENMTLVKDAQGRQRATQLARILIPAYPESIMYPDGEGRLPFVAPLHQWIDSSYEEEYQTKYGGRASYKLPGLLKHLPRQSEPSTFDSVRPHDVDDKLFPGMEMAPYAEWCLHMMSMVLDDMVGKGILKESYAKKNVREQMDARRRYVSDIVESVPYLLKSVLFVDGGVGPTRKRIMQASFIRRALLCKDAVGPWLQTMVIKKGIPSKIAIDYFQMLSQTTASDFVGPKRTPDNDDAETFHRERERVYRAIERMELIIPSLVVQEKEEIERASTTNVVWYIMNRSLSKPFVVGLLMIDFILHLTLMLSFRSDVNLNYPEDGFLADVPASLVPAICCHYIIRKFCEALSYMMMSRKAFRDSFLSIWNILDILAVVLTLVADSLRKKNPNEYNAGLNALALGLLWVKVLGFLKFANKETALFILALEQIILDIRYFMLVFFVVIFAFADMLHIIITTEDPSYCSAVNGTLPDSQEDFCSAYTIDYYYRMYAVLIGEFDIADYRDKDSAAIDIVFFIFTILGVIILLNVLIAVISDSYSNSKEKSLLLFGRARLAFVAEHAALESFLRPGKNPFLSLQKFLSGGLVLRNKKLLCFAKLMSSFLRWLVIFSLIGSALIVDIAILEEMIRFRLRPLFFFGHAAIAVSLSVAIWLVGVYVFGDFFRVICGGIFRPAMFAADRFAEVFTIVLTVKILGLQTEASSKDSLLTAAEVEEINHKENMDEELMDHFFIMEKSLRNTVHETRTQLMKRMDATEKRYLKTQESEKDALVGQLSKLVELLETKTLKES